ncbi:hypothetical protein D3C78_612290 [compost metagenome]
MGSLGSGTELRLGAQVFVGHRPVAAAGAEACGLRPRGRLRAEEGALHPRFGEGLHHSGVSHAGPQGDVAGLCGVQGDEVVVRGVGGQLRGGAIGDVVARILEHQGQQVGAVHFFAPVTIAVGVASLAEAVFIVGVGIVDPLFE